MLWWTLKRLKSKDWTVREHAAQKLGDSGSQRAVGPLIDALRDESASVREAATKALGRLPGTAAVAPLIAALKDEREAAEVALIRARLAKAMAALAESRQSSSDLLGPVLGAIKRLKKLHSSEDLLRQALDAPSISVNDAAAEAIVTLISDDPNRLNELIGLVVDDRNDSLQLAAVVVVARKLGAAALEPLASALRSRHANVRIAAAKELGTLGNARAVAALTEALGDNHCYSEEKSTGWGGRIDDSWEVTVYPVRDAAEEALMSIGGPEAESSLAEYRSRREPRGRPSKGWEL